MSHFQELQACLAARVRAATLVKTRLPLAPEISLALLDSEYPQGRLNDEEAIALMDEPPYWSFCWASGQVLARKLLDCPQWVTNRPLVDFGAGSGVVAIAAALAGCERVIACDSDPLALQACAHNAHLNGVHLELCESLSELGRIADGAAADATICVADVFYDRDNLPLLKQFNKRFAQVLVADSRLQRDQLPAVQWLETVYSHTVPDLQESSEFNRVNLYRGGYRYAAPGSNTAR